MDSETGSKGVKYSSKDILNTTLAGKSDEYIGRNAQSKDSATSGRPSRKKRLVLAVAIFIAAVVVVDIFVVRALVSKMVADTVTSDDFILSVSDNEEIYDEKDDELTEEQVTSDLADMQEQIDAAETNESKAAAYLERGLYYADLTGLNDNWDYSEQALSDLHQAEDLAPTVDTALWLCTYEEAFNGEDAAEEWCDRVTERDPDYVMEMTYEQAGEKGGED